MKDTTIETLASAMPNTDAIREHDRLECDRLERDRKAAAAFAKAISMLTSDDPSGEPDA